MLCCNMSGIGLDFILINQLSQDLFKLLKDYVMSNEIEITRAKKAELLCDVVSGEHSSLI